MSPATCGRELKREAYELVLETVKSPATCGRELKLVQSALRTRCHGRPPRAGVN